MSDFPEMPRIFTAIAEWAACLIYILFFKNRLHGVKRIIALIGALFIFQLYHKLAEQWPITFWIPSMIGAVVLTFLFIYSMCDITLASAACWSAQALILAEFTASLEWQLFYYVSENFDIVKSEVGEAIFFQVFFVSVYIGAYFLERRYMQNSEILSLGWKDFLTVGGIALVIFIASNISVVTTNTPISGRYAMEVFYIRTLVDLCGILLLYVQREGRYRMHANSEIAALQNTLVRQYEQYRLSKESIDIINHKYHDLKHQIAVIRSEKDEAVRETYLEEMEKALNNYGAQHKTGNSVLDTILTSKNIVCAENHIQFTCVADGSMLEFMNVMDICSLFGNALDNAIESVSAIPDIEKRFINVSVYAQNRLLLIRVENYFEGELRESDGGLLSTKKDATNHGYGIKSIRKIAEKYGGSLKIDTENNIFTLCVLLPLLKQFDNPHAKTDNPHTI